MFIQVSMAIASACGQLLYWALRLARSPHRKVVMISRQSDSPSRDFVMLAQELRSRADAPEIILMCREVPDGLFGKLRYLGETIRQMHHLASSRVCIVDGYIPAVSLLTHGAELTVIQMWHALGAIKKFGRQSVDRPGGRSRVLAESMRMHRNYDVVLCGGPATIPVFAEAFGVDASAVKPLGLPRIDYLRARAVGATPLDSDALAALYRANPRLGEASMTRVLYAPTFRRGFASAIDAVARAFSPARFTVVFKPHALDETRVSAEHVVDARGLDVLELLGLCDVVVTDYSAVAFEAAAVGVPVCFYVADIERYREQHGLNIDPLEDLPDISSRDIDEVVERIASDDLNGEAAEAFFEPYLPPSSSACTTSIADLVSDRLAD